MAAGRTVIAAAAGMTAVWRVVEDSAVICLGVQRRSPLRVCCLTCSVVRKTYGVPFRGVRCRQRRLARLWLHKINRGGEK